VEPPLQPIIPLDGTGREQESLLGDAILATYDLRADDLHLRKNPALFEKLRGDYPVRREFGAYTVRITNVPDDTICKLKNLGFRI
jgi:erythronate-4-phosphate dehydrogenase